MPDSSTDRLYRCAQKDFHDWCLTFGVQQPAKSETIAHHLEYCLLANGPSSVAMRASALGKLYREQGWGFDTKAPPIQQVLMTARAQIRARK
jgi:hypothetical protein